MKPDFTERLLRGLYSLALYALLPVTIYHLVWRGFRHPAYLSRWNERYAVYGDEAASNANAQRTLQRMLLQSGNQRLFTDDDTGLRAAQQFVTGEGHQINPGGQQPLRHRFGRQAVLRHINQ